VSFLHYLGAFIGASLLVYGFFQSGGARGLRSLAGAGLMFVGLGLMVMSLLLGFVPDFFSS
jgi:hypothetical protein